MSNLHRTRIGERGTAQAEMVLTVLGVAIALGVAVTLFGGKVSESWKSGTAALDAGRTPSTVLEAPPVTPPHVGGAESPGGSPGKAASRDDTAATLRRDPKAAGREGTSTVFDRAAGTPSRGGSGAPDGREDSGNSSTSTDVAGNMRELPPGAPSAPDLFDQFMEGRGKNGAGRYDWFDQEAWDDVLFHARKITRETAQSPRYFRDLLKDLEPRFQDARHVKDASWMTAGQQAQSRFLYENLSRFRAVVAEQAKKEAEDERNKEKDEQKLRESGDALNELYAGIRWNDAHKQRDEIRKRIAELEKNGGTGLDPKAHEEWLRRLRLYEAEMTRILNQPKLARLDPFAAARADLYHRAAMRDATTQWKQLSAENELWAEAAKAALGRMRTVKKYNDVAADVLSGAGSGTLAGAVFTATVKMAENVQKGEAPAMAVADTLVSTLITRFKLKEPETFKRMVGEEVLAATLAASYEATSAGLRKDAATMSDAQLREAFVSKFTDKLATGLAGRGFKEALKGSEHEKEMRTAANTAFNHLLQSMGN